jgi:poly-gamma-glutamate capsule biosynthesis protein CapA/YwtB (metallophosphatase superfamily)
VFRSLPKIAFLILSAVAAGGAALLLVNDALAGEPESSPAAASPTTSSTSSTTTSTTSTSTTTTTTLRPKGELVIEGTGDVNLDPTYISALGENGYDYAWQGLDGLFTEDDLTVVNLECAPSDIGEAQSKKFVFRCPVESLTSLARAGIEVANLGNNHSGDYGKEALVDGITNLVDAGVAPVGAGVDDVAAGSPALFEVNGWKIAVLGFGGVYGSTDWFAAEDRPGMRNGDDIPSMVEAVSMADEVADIVIVAIHWGVELDTEPRPDDVERAQAMIDAGADVIFGHHAHRLQPFEMVDGAAVFWGLGNFVWPNFSTAGSTTAVARAIVHADGTIEGCLIPAFIEQPGQPVLTEQPECGPGA